jgi:hypothetical protein
MATQWGCWNASALVISRFEASVVGRIRSVSRPYWVFKRDVILLLEVKADVSEHGGLDLCQRSCSEA